MTLAVCLFCALLSMAADVPCEITVRPDQSIQSAIDRAPIGAVICLAAGTWNEAIVITKSVTIRGQPNGQSIIRRPEHEDALWIGSALSETSITVAIEELVVTRSGATPGSSLMMDLGGAIYAQGSAHVTLLSLELSLGAFGIMITDSVQAVVTRCGIHDNEVHGVSASSFSSVTIEDCTLSRNKYGIVATDAASCRVISCAIVESQLSGLLLFGSSETVVYNSTIAGGRIAYGIQIADSGQVAVRDCDVSRNGVHGIDLKDSSLATIENCAISDNRNGILLSEHATAHIIGNRIFGNRECGAALTSGFAGRLTGKANEIPEPSDPKGNQQAAILPNTLQFLLTDEGGEL